MADVAGSKKKKMVFGLFESPTPYKGQKYSDLKKQAIASGHPFIDSEFPPDDKALSNTPGKFSGITWKRPKVSQIHLFISYVCYVCKYCRRFTSFWQQYFEELRIVCWCSHGSENNKISLQ